MTTSGLVFLFTFCFSLITKEEELSLSKGACGINICPFPGEKHLSSFPDVNPQAALRWLRQGLTPVQSGEDKHLSGKGTVLSLLSNMHQAKHCLLFLFFVHII